MWYRSRQLPASQWRSYVRGRIIAVLMLRKEASINTGNKLVLDAKSNAIRHLTKQRREGNKLQPTHLAIVRAALTFWDEEMGGVSHEIYRHYLHSNDKDVVLTAESVARARMYFNQVVLKFGLLDLKTGAIVSTELTNTPDELHCKSGQQIVSVLIH